MPGLPQHVSGQEWKQSLSSGTDTESIPGECRPDKQHKDDIRGMSPQSRVKLTLEIGGESAEALPEWPLGRWCLCTSVCQVQWGNTGLRQQSGVSWHTPFLPTSTGCAHSMPCPPSKKELQSSGASPGSAPCTVATDPPSANTSWHLLSASLLKRGIPCQKTARNHSDHHLGLWPCPTVGQGLCPKLPWKSGSPWAHPTRH